MMKSIAAVFCALMLAGTQLEAVRHPAEAPSWVLLHPSAPPLQPISRTCSHSGGFVKKKKRAITNKVNRLWEASPSTVLARNDTTVLVRPRARACAPNCAAALRVCNSMHALPQRRSPPFLATHGQPPPSPGDGSVGLGRRAMGGVLGLVPCTRTTGVDCRSSTMLATTA